MIEKENLNKIIVFSLIGVLVILAYFLLRPIILAIIMGFFFAYILAPAYLPIKRKIKNDNLAALLFMLALISIIAVPLWFFLPVLVREIFDTYLYVQKLDISGVAYNLFNSFLAPDSASALAIQSNLLVTKFFNYTLTSFSSIFSNITGLLFQSMVFIFTFFFGIRDSKKIRDYLL